jgi:membrane protein
MSAPAGGTEGDRLRALAARLVGIVGGLRAVRTLRAVLAVYDDAGGGLLAGGLAYTSLLALLPGLLLILSAIGLLVDDPADRALIVASIGEAFPPLREIASLAFDQVAAGAVPSGIVAIVTLLWGSSRFYSSIDRAFSRVFRGSRVRNEIERTIRGIALTAVFVAVPVAVLLAGSAASWMLDLAPVASQLGGFLRTAVQVASPLGSLLLFVGGTAAVYRFVPPTRLPWRVWLAPAGVVGIVLAAFTQLFTFLAPRMVGIAALYGTFVAAFAVLAWFAIGFNVLLLGAAWARIRALAGDAGPESAGRGSGRAGQG